MPDEQVSLTQNPRQEIELRSVELDDQKRGALGRACYDSIKSALATRSFLDVNLDSWDAFYEMKVQPKNFPFPNSSGFFVPMIPDIVEELVAGVAGSVFVPGFYQVTGTTEAAAQHAHEVERYYNTEFQRKRWLKEHLNMTHLGVKDGTAIMEVLWNTKEVKEVYEVEEPVLDEETGASVIEDLSTGKVATKKKIQTITRKVLDDVVMRAVALRDFLVVPSWSYSIEDAQAIAFKVYLDEATLRSMIKSESNPDGELWEEAVEQALKYVQPGQDERNMEQQGTETADIGGKVQVGDETPPGENILNMQRGALSCWRYHTKQFDLDGDGIPEENVVFIHDTSEIALGYGRYKYFATQEGMGVARRPAFKFTPFPRPDRHYGFSLIERLAPLQTELNMLRNGRVDWITTTLFGPWYKMRNTEVKDPAMRWSPDTMYDVDQPDAIGRIPTGQLDPAAFAETSQIVQDAKSYAGLADMGVAPSSRQTKAQIQAQAVAQGIKKAFMAEQLRWTCLEIFQFIHDLKKQYQKDVTVTTRVGGIAETLSIPKPVLAMEYELGIAGTGGPLDKENRLQEDLFLNNTLKSSPLVTNHPRMFQLTYNIDQLLLRDFSRESEAISLIGSEDEAKKMDEARAQAAQMQAQQQQAAAQMGGQPGQAPPGQPSGAGQPSASAQGGGAQNGKASGQPVPGMPG